MTSGEGRSGSPEEEGDGSADDSRKTQNTAALETEILNLFRNLVSQRKLLLYIDSLHWMDPVSRRLLQRMMIELGNERLFLTAACRTDGKQAVRDLLLALNERALVTTIHLSCFTEEEVGELVKREPFQRLTPGTASRAAEENAGGAFCLQGGGGAGTFVSFDEIRTAGSGGGAGTSDENRTGGGKGEGK